MSPRPHCAHCGAADVIAEADRVKCLACGEYTDFHDRPLPVMAKFSRPSFQEQKAAGEVQ